MIADDFKAIRERRDQLGGHDIIKEYVTPASERELTPVEQMRKEAELLADWFGLRLPPLWTTYFGAEE